MGRPISKRKRFLGVDGEWHYFCRMCEEWLPQSMMPVNAALSFGVGTLCKKCNRIYVKKYNDKKVPKIPKKVSKEFGTRFVESTGKSLMYQHLTDEDYDVMMEQFRDMGYDITKSIHEQFINKINDKYGLNLKCDDVSYIEKEDRSKLPPKLRK